MMKVKILKPVEKLDPKLKLEFIKKLGLIGFNHLEEQTECGIRYLQRSESKLFSAEKIPHISKEDIPEGIISIEYTITLDNLVSITADQFHAIDWKFRGD